MEFARPPGEPRNEGEMGMRALALLSLLFVASCGDGTAENKAAEAPDAPAAGQWALSSQVTNFHNTDHGRAAIDTPVGTPAPPKVLVAGPGREATQLLSGAGATSRYRAY